LRTLIIGFVSLAKLLFGEPFLVTMGCWKQTGAKRGRIGFSVTLALMLLSGCTNSPSAPSAPKPDSSAKKSDTHTANSASNNQADRLTAFAEKTDVQLVDPNTGEILWKGKIARTTVQTTHNRDAYGDLEDIDSVYYENSQPSGRLIAPRASADETTDIIRGFGGVKLISIIRPGTTLSSDNATFFAKKHMLIGDGHVVFRDVSGAVQRGTSFEADTKMRHVVMPAPSLKSVQNQPVLFDAVDPKSQKPIWSSKSTRSVIDAQGTSNFIIASFEAVDGVFYQDSKQMCRMTAPKVTVDQKTRQVTATGGVKIVSIDKAGIVVTCDSATYFEKEGKLIGRGSVIIQNSDGSRRTGPSFSANVRLSSWEMPAPDLGRLTGRPITSIIKVRR